MEPAASVRKTTLTGSLVKPCPTAAPTKVGPPPIRPRAARNAQLGRAVSASCSEPPRPSVGAGGVRRVELDPRAAPDAPSAASTDYSPGLVPARSASSSARIRYSERRAVSYTHLRAHETR